MTDRIVVDSKIHFGKPCVADTRITVKMFSNYLMKTSLLIGLAKNNKLHTNYSSHLHFISASLV